MGYVDPHQSDDDFTASSGPLSKRAVQADKTQATSFDREVLFSKGGTYNGSPSQIARLAAHSGKTVETGEMLAERLKAKRAADAVLPED